MAKTRNFGLVLNYEDGSRALMGETYPYRTSSEKKANEHLGSEGEYILINMNGGAKKIVSYEVVELFRVCGTRRYSPEGSYKFFDGRVH